MIKKVKKVLTAQEIEDAAVEKMLKRIQKTSKARRLTISILG